MSLTDTETKSVLLLLVVVVFVSQAYIQQHRTKRQKKEERRYRHEQISKAQFIVTTITSKKYDNVGLCSVFGCPQGVVGPGNQDW